MGMVEERFSDIEERLKEYADESYRDFHSKIVPSSRIIHGVRMPTLRNMAKGISKGDWRGFLNERTYSHEGCMIRAIIVATANMSIDERIELSKMYIPEIDNWALCDIFCGDWKVKKNERDKLWNLCMNLIETKKEFEMRISVVMMLGHFLDDEYIDRVLEILEKYHHDGYYYKMGAAWTLSFCFIKYPERTEPVLFSEKLDNDIRNKAVQKISDSYRVEKSEKERLKAKKAAMRS